ncbi:hypothetical protein N2152v2_006347 [Parachlorella kessleri]
MLAWKVRRLCVALFTHPARLLMELVSHQLEELAIAPERFQGQRHMGSTLQHSQTGNDDDPPDEEGLGPDWVAGNGPVGELARLPSQLKVAELGSGVVCPLTALTNAPGLRHLTLDWDSAVRGPLEFLRELPRQLMSLTLSVKTQLGTLEGRVLQLPVLLQHGSLEKIAFRMDITDNPGRCQVLVDGTPADLWQLSQKVQLELRANAPWQHFSLLFLPKSAGPPDGYGNVSFYRWQAGKYILCTLLPPGELPMWEAGPLTGKPGAALARSVRTLLPDGRKGERVGTLFGEEGELDDDDMLDFSENESSDDEWL